MATDASNLRGKIMLRKYFLEKIPNPKILECFAGENRKLFHACYEGLDCLSLDIKSVKGAVRVDNKVFIASQDMNPYNFFDLDAYGSPWELVLNVMHRKEDSTDPFVLVCTEGTGRKLGFGQTTNLIKTVIHNKTGIVIPRLDFHQEYIMKLIMDQFTKRYNMHPLDGKIIRVTEGINTNDIFYFGVLLQPNPRHIQYLPTLAEGLSTEETN